MDECEPPGRSASGDGVDLWRGFSSGAGSELRYDGEALAAKGPIVVTMNYRLGMLGFFAHPELAKESGHNASGNYGMMDAIAALQWVKKNISAFGGDPGNVTIFGESAGAIMIGGLVGSPEAKGLFHRAIAQSGGMDGAADGSHVVGNAGAGAGCESGRGARREDDRRAAREAACRAHRPWRRRAGHRRLHDSGGSLHLVCQRQAERR